MDCNSGYVLGQSGVVGGGMTGQSNAVIQKEIKSAVLKDGNDTERAKVMFGGMMTFSNTLSRGSIMNLHVVALSDILQSS
jgi:hypothetical protein